MPIVGETDKGLYFLSNQNIKTYIQKKHVNTNYRNIADSVAKAIKIVKDELNEGSEKLFVKDLEVKKIIYVSSPEVK